MEHTPGPWRLSDTPKDEIFNRYLLTGPGNEIIATIHAPMAPVELPESEVEANARLLSSAPDLLEALRNMITTEDIVFVPESDAFVEYYECQHCGRIYDDDNDDNDDPYGAVPPQIPQMCESDDCPANVARAAIKRATGD